MTPQLMSGNVGSASLHLKGLSCLSGPYEAYSVLLNLGGNQCDVIYKTHEYCRINTTCFLLFTWQITHWGYTPGWNHLLWSLDTLCSCWHRGNAGSECVWMSWMWFMIEVHLATFSGPESELLADQYRWLVMLLCHFFTKLQSFSLEIFSTFFDNPDEVKFTGKTYLIFVLFDAVSFFRNMDSY